MHEIDTDTDRRPGAADTDPAGDAIGNPDTAWRPDDPPPLGGEFGGTAAGAGSTLDDGPGSVPDAAWSSAEAAPSADVVPTPGRPPADPRSFVGPEDTPSRGLRKPPVPSAAAIAGHPIHPMLVPLPIGALSLALASDLAYAATGDRFWARASTALLGAGVVTGAVAGAVGSIDFLSRERVREHGESWLHAGGNVAALALTAINLAVRQPDAARRVVPTGLALSALTGGLLLITGWLGGELSYRHRVGVTAD
jgi:uncharacterized membrane protein